MHAGYGRGHVAHFNSDTNNLVERFFLALKYTFSRGRVLRRVDDLLKLLLTEVFPFYVTARMRRTSGAEFATADALDLSHANDVAFLVNITGHHGSGALVFVQEALGLANCDSRSEAGLSYTLAVADGSCQCPANRDDVCKHVEAAAQLCPLTVPMMKAGAASIGKWCAEGWDIFCLLSPDIARALHPCSRSQAGHQAGGHTRRDGTV